VGCGGGSSSSSEGDAAAAPTVDPSLEVGSLAVNPGDGVLYIGSSAGAYTLPAGAAKPEKLRTAMVAPGRGTGPLIDLVLRFSGPNTIVASGHSSGGTLPLNVGFFGSGDAGKSWRPISGMNDADYHDIEVVGPVTVGLRIDDPNSVQVSSDGGKTFEAQAAPAASAALDIAVNPADPKLWAVGTEQGVFISTNEGGSWRQRDTTAKARLAWAAADALYSAGLDGKLRLSADGGKSWNETGGSLGGAPLDFVAGPKGELYAYMKGGKVVQSTDRGKTFKEIATVR
jgi:hypothetical protein